MPDPAWGEACLARPLPRQPTLHRIFTTLIPTPEIGAGTLRSLSSSLPDAPQTAPH